MFVPSSYAVANRGKLLASPKLAASPWASAPRGIEGPVAANYAAERFSIDGQCQALLDTMRGEASSFCFVPCSPPARSAAS
jgi:hypothetical protein